MEIKKTYAMSGFKYTNSTIFMVKTLNIPRNELKNNDFLNAYSKDNLWDKHSENAIYLLFRPKDLDRFRTFLDSEYERTKSVIEDYGYPDGFFVVVYQLDPNFKVDFDLVRQGKYSKTSLPFQNLFPKLIKIERGGISSDEISLQYRVFNKTLDLKKFWEDKFNITYDEDQAVWDGYREDDETLNIDKIKAYLSRI